MWTGNREKLHSTTQNTTPDNHQSDAWLATIQVSFDKSDFWSNSRTIKILQRSSKPLKTRRRSSWHSLKLCLVVALVLNSQPWIICMLMCFYSHFYECVCEFLTTNPQHTNNTKYNKRSIEIWLILPVVICLFQGLSHACLRITAFAGICAWLITSDVICRKHFAVSARLDTLAKRQANTWI